MVNNTVHNVNQLHLNLEGELIQNWILPNIVGMGMHLETCSELESEPVFVSEKINYVATASGMSRFWKLSIFVDL